MKRPNILFLFPDQHRREWFPYEDKHFQGWEMKKPDLHLPNIESIQKNGVTFLNAVTSSPLCAPARACLASGTRYHHCETLGNDDDFPLEKPTIYSALRNTGYEVLGCGKFDLRKFSCDWFNEENQEKLGFSKCIDNEGKMDATNHYNRFGEARGPYMAYLEQKGLAKIHAQDFTGRKRKTHPTPLSEEEYCDNWITQNCLNLLQSAKQGKPWFMQVNFTGPHAPFDVTQRMLDTVKNRHFDLAHQGVFEENALEIRQCYAAMIENLDRNIGLILDYLRETNQLEQTVIVYASDHGEMLGDRGRYSKIVPFRGSIDIPMVISGDYIQRKGAYDDSLVELQDLTATFAELTGTQFPQAVDSKSLLPVLTENTSVHRDFAYSAINVQEELGYRAVLTHTHKYIHYVDDSKALYDRINDPWEDENIVLSDLALVETMASLLQSVE